MRPFFGYYGGKWRASQHYPTPTHRTIVEPFAGSAGYSIRHHDRDVILCDADPIIRGVWRYLLSVTPADILSIPDIPQGGTVDDLPVSQEARWLVGFWLNRGVSSPRPRPSKWMREGLRPGSFWGDRVRQTIASQVESIRHWRVVDGGYEDLPDIGPATWFVDPPYETAGRHYRYGSTGIDYASLAAWCRRRSGQVIVCENDGASWLPFKPWRVVRANRKLGADGMSKELLWVNHNA